MGSVKHPRLYDPATMKLVKETFNEVWEVVEGQDALSINDDCGVLQSAIIRRLLDLASDGVTDKDMLKTEALKQLPLRKQGDAARRDALYRHHVHAEISMNLGDVLAAISRASKAK